jgi:ATP-dependent RNA helicase RhlE
MTDTFHIFPIQANLIKAIHELGYTEPTPIQVKAIKPILSGNQVVGIAQTGTGKTAAYAIPLISKLYFAKGSYPRALILAPTRELAIQIHKHVGALAVYTDLRIGVVYGGAGLIEQRKMLEKGVDILIGTPGRLWEFYKKEVLVFKHLGHLVLDEADKMLDMGFLPAIHQLLEVLPSKRQTLLFSATMSLRVRNLYADFMEFPVVIEVSPEATPAVGIYQLVYMTPNFKTKINLLTELLDGEQEGRRDIIFCKTKTSANQIVKFIVRRYGENSVRIIHGNKDQNTRMNAVKEFERGLIHYLVATDVVARGIDIAGVNRVFNFDIPLVTEDYIHRIGRTARAGNTGEAITFCSPQEVFYLNRIEKLMKQTIQEKSLPPEVEISETPFEEKQLQDRELDEQRRKIDPTFKGAFHEKKHKKS